jgi:alpha-D-xyloside xylohydrolase
MPVLVKEGAIIPTGPAIQYTNEKPAEVITLFIYTGKEASFTLYEDENTNYNYEKGAFATIPFTWSEATNTLTIGKRAGAFNGMLNKRTFRIIWIDKNNPRAFDAEQGADATVMYKGNAITIKRKPISKR